MKTIIFPGHHRQPAEAADGVVLEDNITRLVVWQTPRQAPWNEPVE